MFPILLQKQVKPTSLSSVQLEVDGEVMTLGSLPTGMSVDLLHTHTHYTHTHTHTHTHTQPLQYGILMANVLHVPCPEIRGHRVEWTANRQRV